MSHPLQELWFDQMDGLISISPGLLIWTDDSKIIMFRTILYLLYSTRSTQLIALHTPSSRWHLVRRDEVSPRTRTDRLVPFPYLPHVIVGHPLPHTCQPPPGVGVGGGGVDFCRRLQQCLVLPFLSSQADRNTHSLTAAKPKPFCPKPAHAAFIISQTFLKSQLPSKITNQNYNDFQPSPTSKQLLIHPILFSPHKINNVALRLQENPISRVSSLVFDYPSS